MRTNRTVNIYRPTSPSGVGGTRTYQLRRPAVRAWISLRRSVFVGVDGEARSSEGVIRSERNLQLQEGDVVQIVDGTLDDRRYRLEDYRELWSASGRIVGHSARLLRDTSLEG